MKKLLTFIAIYFSITVIAQPKPKFDSSKLINNTLYNYFSNNSGALPPLNAGSVIFPQQGTTGIFSDSNRNVIIGTPSSITGNSVNNFVQADNVTINNGSNNSVFGKNLKIDNANNVFAQVTDGHFYPGAHYSGAVGDALGIGAYGSFTIGFGDWNFIQYSLVAGNNNVAGSLLKPQSDSEATSWSNRYFGGAIIGQNIRTQGNDIYAIGNHFNSTQTGFHIGFGKDEFSVLPGDIVMINGISYHWPSTQPQPGAVLTYTGSNNLDWVVPAIQQRSNQPQEQQIIQAFQIFNTAGQYLGTQTLILKPINKQQ
jgi:hypothetical protein